MSNESSQFGRYRLLAELGHGGMADVFLAVAHGPGGFSKLQVLKRLRPNLADDPEFIAMLVDEARLAARLNHPNVVQTNEIGNVGNHYFIAMEFLDGQPLHRVTHRARTKGGIASEMQFGIMADVLAGLHHAHELADFDGTPLGVVHRDVTPHNIFVTYDGQVKVVDFGIAKAVGRAAAETRQGVIKGKVAYMAPEQAMGMQVDRRADLFSVGIMLWEAATGVRMWKGVEDMQILHRLIRGEVPRSPKAIDPQISARLDEICQKALAQEPNDRYQTAGDMQADIEEFLIAEGKRAPQRELGKRVAELFADKRLEIKDIIEAKLAEIRTVPSKEFTPAHISLDATQSSSRMSVDVSIPMSGATPAAAVASVASVDLQAEEGTRRVFTGMTEASREGAAGAKSHKGRNMGVLAAGLAMAAVIGIVAMRGGNAPAGTTTATGARAPVEHAAAVIAPVVTAEPAATASPAAVATAQAQADDPKKAPVVNATAPRRPVTVAKPVGTAAAAPTVAAATTTATPVTSSTAAKPPKGPLGDDDLSTRK